MTGLAQYARVGRVASAAVINVYSTSFGLATSLLPPRVRHDIRSVYALVRIADEIVDGPGAEAGLDALGCRRELDELEQQTQRGMQQGFSSNPVVHAFSETAERVGIGTELTNPFFASMRRDLTEVHFTEEAELKSYVYGSAEVIGLMCARCFTYGFAFKEDELARIDQGARALGSAFQLVNFLRDLGADANHLGRRYLPGVDPSSPSQTAVNTVLDTVDAQLATARAAVSLLPRAVRPAVQTAHDVFADLAVRIRRVPAAELVKKRIRVPNARKMALALGATRRLFR